MDAHLSQNSLLDEISRNASKARRIMIEVLIHAGCGHPGGAFSCVDTLAALYFGVLKVDPANPAWPDRDRFILSKGHSSVALYTILHLKGYFGLDRLMTFRQNGSALCGHPDMRKVPGVEMNTGSLGHGLSVGVGLALAASLDRKGYRTFVLMGDGETQEGAVWEAAMSAGHFRLDNLVGIVDRNKLQIDGFTEDIMTLEPFTDKWKAFGWGVREVDGHRFDEILDAFNAVPFVPGRPSLIIANTIKGKGVSFMENSPQWHGKALSGEYADRARKEWAEPDCETADE